ncbi:MAG: RusA family crossover junction endodeoxyribonuclease [Nitrospirales bacterium]
MSKPIRIRQHPDLTKANVQPKELNSRVKTRQPLGMRQSETSLASLPSSISATNISLTLPLPPSINHQYATVNGRRILSSKGRQYKASVAQEIMFLLTASSSREILLNNLNTHSLTFSIWFYFSSALRRDLDGGLKIAQDAICNALDINDNRIGEIHLYRAIDASTPRMECTLAIQQSSPLPRQKNKQVSSRKQATPSLLPRRSRRS